MRYLHACNVSPMDAFRNRGFIGNTHNRHSAFLSCWHQILSFLGIYPFTRLRKQLLFFMRILGIDPGLQTTGFGVIDCQGAQLHYVASGTIRTTRTPGVALGDLPARLKILFDGIHEVVQHYQPTQAAVEIVFVNVNPQSTLLLGQARGAALTALVTQDLPVAEYTALQMKKAMTGNGRAAKAQIQAMVQHMLHLPGLPGPDAADALGLAITHAHAAPMLERLHNASPLQRRQHAMLKAGRVY